MEFAKTSPAVQEVEFARRSPGRSHVHVVIDGNDVATATADRQGNPEIEFEGSAAQSLAR